MWFRVLAATALLAVPACLNIPAFKPPGDGPPGDGDDTPASSVNLVNGTGGDHTAMGADFAVHFPALGAQFPDQITRHGDPLLTGTASGACDEPSGAGIALSPSEAVDGLSDPGLDHNTTFTVLASGPSLVEVAIGWHAQTSCTTGSKGITGRSIYAITPDARIVRFDAIDPPMELLNSSQCECSPGGAMPPWSLRSELSVAFPVVTNVVDSSLKPVVISDTLKQDQIVCGSGPEHSIGFGFQRPQVRVRQPSPLALTFTYDFQDTPSMLLDPGKPISATSSAYLLGDAQGCSASVGKLAAFSGNPLLSVNEAPIETGVDGVYGGNDGSGKVGLSVPETTMLRSSNQPIPAGFVVWLDFGPNHNRFDVTSSAHTGTDWFRISQATPQGQVILWFRDALGPTDTITVTAGN